TYPASTTSSFYSLSLHDALPICRRLDLHPVAFRPDFFDLGAAIKPSNDTEIFAGSGPEIEALDVHGVIRRLDVRRVSPDRCVRGQLNLRPFGGLAPLVFPGAEFLQHSDRFTLLQLRDDFARGRGLRAQVDPVSFYDGGFFGPDG